MSTKNRKWRFPRNLDDVLRLCDFVEKQVKRWRALADMLDHTLDPLEVMLAEIRTEAKSIRPESFDPGRLPVYSQKNPALENILQHEAENGIDKFEFERRSDGKITATIDGTPVTLSPVLGELLIVLADRTPTQVDPKPTILVSWKQADEVQSMMQLRRGGHFSRKNVWNSVNKLRNRLSEAFLNPHFIQTNKEKGLVRLALRNEGQKAEPA